MRRVLIVTNDFPPRRGGIQSFVHALAARLPAVPVCVYAPDVGGGGGVRRPAAVPGRPAPHLADAARPDRGPPRGRSILARVRLRHRAVRCGGAAGAAGAQRCAAPGARRIVALTHGHEAGWAALPAARVAAAPHRRRGGRRHLPGRVLPAPAGPRALAGGRGAHGPAGARRGHHGLPARRRGRGHPAAARHRPAASPWWSASPGWCRARARTRCSGPGRWCGPRSAAIRCCCWSGDGPYRAELGRLAERLGGATRCCSPGRCPAEELPAYYDAGNVFAMPCRTRRERPGRGGPRHRLPGGVGHRPAGGRRRLGRRAGRHPARRDGLRGARPAARTPSRPG